MKLLDARQIKQKVVRLAIEILENNFEAQELFLVGINNNGASFANRLKAELEGITDVAIKMANVSLSPADPLATEVTLDLPKQALDGKVIIVVDDVANTGRTLHYAMKPFLDILPKKIEVAVLVDRKHKSFPIAVDYVGMTLATTIQEDIDVQIRDVNEAAVFLN